jgi:cobalt-zinc-cadmium efflux system outer membrane protein
MTRFTHVVAISIAAAALLVPGVAASQELTVEQLVAMALKQSPALQAARADIAVRSAQATQSALRPNPSLVGTHDHDPGGMMISRFELEWPLDYGRGPARAAAAERQVEVTSMSVRERERLLASAVREQAGRLLAARRALDVTSEALVAARRMRDLLDRRVTEGGIPKLDANVAAVEAMRIEADVALATADVEAETIELKALAGLAADAPLMLRDSLEGLVASPMVPRLTAAAAMESRPDLREALARIGAAEARGTEARQNGRLDLSLVAGYSRNHLEFPQSGLDEHHSLVPIQNSYHAFTVGARAMLPFRNRNEGTIAAAQAERDGAEALFAARRLAARAEIDAAVARERETRRAVEMYATTIRDLARQNVDVMLEGYDLGRFPLSDVLMEQRRYLEVEAGYTMVLARAYEARTAVARAFGEVP